MKRITACRTEKPINAFSFLLNDIPPLLGSTAVVPFSSGFFVLDMNLSILFVSFVLFLIINSCVLTKWNHFVYCSMLRKSVSDSQAKSEVRQAYCHHSTGGYSDLSCKSPFMKFFDKFCKIWPIFILFTFVSLIMDKFPNIFLLKTSNFISSNYLFSQLIVSLDMHQNLENHFRWKWKNLKFLSEYPPMHHSQAELGTLQHQHSLEAAAKQLYFFLPSFWQTLANPPPPTTFHSVNSISCQPWPWVGHSILHLYSLTSYKQIFSRQFSWCFIDQSTEKQRRNRQSSRYSSRGKGNGKQRMQWA